MRKEMNAKLHLLLPCLSASLHNPKTFAHKIIGQWKRDGALDSPQKNLPLLMRSHNFTKPQVIAVADEILRQQPAESVLHTLMLCFAENDLLLHFRCIWDQLLNSASLPPRQTLASLFRCLASFKRFHEISELLAELSSRFRSSSPKEVQSAFSVAVDCFAKAGEIELMESTLHKMASEGISIDAAAANSYVKCYSVHGSLSEMESAYGRLKKSRYCIDKEGIRAMALGYLKEKKMYRLGEFTREVGLGRSDVGNLLWNLLLLSYAASFKMKSLQREFLKMRDCGFSPDITTFNVRGMAFSRMSLHWDLHLGLQHMRRDSVVPDIVTFGCIVDSYVERRLARNLDFALASMAGFDGSYPAMMTDPLVFEVLGKGDFHASSEAFMEFSADRRDWTYKKLVHVYMKKHYRRNQVFWNY